MSILIQGMEMPQNCGECPFIFTSWGIEYYCHLAESSTSAEYVGREKMANCPLIELPPHGRLADLDQMIEDYRDGNHMEIDEGDLKAISQYKVVIEAEGSET